MKSKVRGALGALWVAVFSSVFLGTPGAASANEPAPGSVIRQGDGWQVMPANAVQGDGDVSTSSAAGHIVVVENLTGLGGAPLPESIKAELAAELPPALASAGEPQVAIAVHLEAAQAVAAGDEATVFAEYVEPDAPGGEVNGLGLFCDTGWRERAISKSKSLDGFDYDLNESIGHFNGTLDVNVPISGQAGFDFRYAFKKSRLCVPYAVKFINTRAWGELNLNGTLLTAQGSVSYQNDWRKTLGDLFNYGQTFFIGPVPVHVGLKMPVGVGFQFAASASGSIDVSSAGAGTLRFDYTCDFSSCTRTPGTRTSDFALGNLASPTVTGGASVQVDAKPYVFLELKAYLYDEWFASAGLGIEASAPTRFWYALGQVCGDGNADGVLDAVNGGFVDVQGQLSLYYFYKVAGHGDWDWIDWPFGDVLPGTWRVHDTQDMLRGKQPFKSLRLTLMFQPVSPSGAIHPLSPIVTGPKSPGVNTPASYTLKRRECVPLSEPVDFRIHWADGSAQTNVSGATATASHTWATAGSRNVTFTAVRDSAGRTFNRTTTRAITAVETVPPPVPAAINVPAQDNDGTFTVSWSTTPNALDYDLEEKKGSGTWVARGSQTGTSYAVTGRVFGHYQYRVRACNAYGCSGWLTSSTAQVGTPPAAPTLTVRSQLCNGWNDVSWTAMPGATEYRLYSHTSNIPADSVMQFQGPGTAYTMNVSGTTYLWVKACNGAGCSVVSASKMASVTPGCL
ncbi:hypothetical protein ACLESD_33480 [Pyxidicoccus sp. 3LFB2]